MTATRDGSRWVLNFVTYAAGSWRIAPGAWKNGEVWRYLEP
jgi:hypothetical protein